MKRILMAALLTLSATSLGVAGAPAQTTLRFGMNLPQGDSADFKAATAFKEYVEFNSGGRLRVQLFPGGQLGSERQMTEQVRDGALDIAYVADGAATGFYPKLQVLAIPYLFASAPVAWEVLRGPFGREMAADIRTVAGFRVLNMSENGFRDFTNNKRPIRTPEDMKGLKMRTMESPVFIRMMQSLGAAATPIGTSELIMSLQQNVVDGQENAPSTVFQFGIADVQKFMSLDDHVFSAMLLLIANESYDKLPQDLRRIVMDGAVVHANTSNSDRARSTQANIEAIRKKGVQVHMTSSAEKALFKQVAQGPVLDYITQQVGKELVDKLMAATAQAEAVVYGN